MENGSKKLHRSKTDRIIGGVAGGVARYFEVDPLLVRLVFLGIAAISQILPAVITYLVAMILIPKEGEKMKDDGVERIKETAEELKERISSAAESIKANSYGKKSKRSFFGMIFVLLGILLIANVIFPDLKIIGKFWLPAFLILAGFYLIFRKK